MPRTPSETKKENVEPVTFQTFSLGNFTKIGGLIGFLILLIVGCTSGILETIEEIQKN